MAKVTLAAVGNLTNEISAVATIDQNFARLTTALENTLSRDGTVPNQMNSVLDMNSNRIINMAVPVQDTDAARLKDVNDAIAKFAVNIPGNEQGRILEGTNNEIIIANPDGVAGNPRFYLSSSLDFVGKTINGGTFINPGITKAQVGLGLVDNTSDIDKPVSTAQALALALKANIASPTFTGVPAGPTAANGTNTTQLATTAFVIANAAAPSSYDYDNVAAIVGATIPAPRNFLRTAGFYTVGDGGHGLFKRKVSLDVNAFGFASADGAYWQLVPEDGKLNVKQTGARGDGSGDDTTAIQACINATRFVLVPRGNYPLTAPILCGSGLTIIGEGQDNTRLFRSTAYGVTFQFGGSGPGNSAGACHIEGLFLHHISSYNNGSTYVAGTSTVITNRNTPAHIAIYKGQNVTVKHNRVQGAGGISIYGSHVVSLERNIINGQWDNTLSTLQECFAAIGLYNYVDTDASIHFSTEVVLNGNYIGGYGSTPSRSKTVGNATFSTVQNYGPASGVYVETAEGLVIGENYMGGCHNNLILLSSQNVTSSVRIHHNFLDAGRVYAIQIQTGVSTTWPNMITIDHNTSQGYGIDEGFLYINDTGAGAPSCSNIVIEANIGQGYQKAAVYINGAKGVLHTGNQWRDYNQRGSTDGNRAHSSGLYATATYMIHSCNNLYGGATNDPTGGNSCQYGFSSVANATDSCSGERAQNLGLGGGSAANITQTYPT